MKTHDDIACGLAGGGTGAERLARVGELGLLSRPEEFHLAYLPIGDSGLADWKSAAHDLRLFVQPAAAKAEQGALVLEGEVPGKDRTVCLSLAPEPESRLLAVVGVGRRTEYLWTRD